MLDGERELTARWLATMLPFGLTGDQERALDAVDGDLAGTVPMQRLLMGEVGSGKTVVALYAILRAVEHGFQGALMAPTETLAEQHFATIQALMPGAAVPAGLLTGSTAAGRRADLLSKLATGELSMIVGTHALIEVRCGSRGSASRSSTSSTGSASANARRSMQRAPRGPTRTCST